MLSKTLIFILILTICMVVHELGHLFCGILFKAKVKGIHFFYCPGIHLLSSHSKWIATFFPRLKKNPEITIGLNPFASIVLFDYCKDDDSYDHSCHFLENKPAWQQFFVYSGGIIANYLMAIFVAFFLEFHYNPKILFVDSINFGIEDTNNRIKKSCIRLLYVTGKYKHTSASGYYSNNKQERQHCQSCGGTYYEIINSLSYSLDYKSLLFLWHLNTVFFIFNLIPVLPLDGGKMLFSVCEIFFRRKPNPTLITAITLIGVVSLLFLFLYNIIKEIVYYM